MNGFPQAHRINRLRAFVFAGLLGLTALSTAPSQAALYSVGDTVNNFNLIARRPFTGPDGHAYQAGESVPLYNLAGRIIFIEFFYVW